MKALLHINDSICSSLGQLRDIVSEILSPDTPLYEDLLTLQRDGMLAKWLAEGVTDDEKELSKMLNILPNDLPNSELMSKIKHILVGEALTVQKNHFSSYIELQQIRCRVNGNIVILEEYAPHKYQGLINDISNRCHITFLFDFKVIKTDYELYAVNLYYGLNGNDPLGKYFLTVSDKKVGDIITVETKSHYGVGSEPFSIFIENENVAQLALSFSGKVLNVNGVMLDMIKVDGGTFYMGAPETDNDAYDREKPTHKVTLDSFYIGKYEVTLQQWYAVMGYNPTPYPLAFTRNPVVCVSWEHCQIFINELNKLTDMKFRLPTEAEWEYAARGGKFSKGKRFAGSDNIDSVAWYNDNCKNPRQVGLMDMNELGLFDMSGNVWEWCQDWKDDYSDNIQSNPSGPENGSNRVFRGGSYLCAAEECRISYRGYYPPYSRRFDLGLRLAL